MKKDLVDTFYGPPKEGVYSPSVQNTLYLMAKSVLNRSLSFSLLHTHMHTHSQISINTNAYPHSHIDSQVQTHMHMHSHADTHAWACIIKILPLTHMLVFVWYTQNTFAHALRQKHTHEHALSRYFHSPTCWFLYGAMFWDWFLIFACFQVSWHIIHQIKDAKYPFPSC